LFLEWKKIEKETFGAAPRDNEKECGPRSRRRFENLTQSPVESPKHDAAKMA
jgi:hypothetical protein